MYMKPPERHNDYNKCFWKLNKAIYGLKQSGRQEINQFLINIGFKRLISESWLYIKQDKRKDLIYILGVYVDDILIAVKNCEIKNTKDNIKRKYKIKDISYVDFVISVKFIKNNNGYFLHQKRYIEEILKRLKVNNEKLLSNTQPINNEELRKIKFNKINYSRSSVGNLLYVAICTRSDILFLVSKAARKSNDPTIEDWNNIVKIFRYLKGTLNYGINYSKELGIEAYVDADFAGDTQTRRSTTGFLIKIGNSITSWCFKFQHWVSTSTAESEYYSLSECWKHCMWYLNILNELIFGINYITINVDNKAAIYKYKAYWYKGILYKKNY